MLAPLSNLDPNQPFMMPSLHPFLQSLLGGVLIGTASWLLLASLGRVAGISGIAGGLLGPEPRNDEDRNWRWAFILGLMVAGVLTMAWMGQAAIAVPRSPWLLGAAGLLVGFGTILGSGCTSGHGVCGLGRRSVRSLTATLVFMGLGMATVALVKAFAV
jgi:uncharacterized protein